MSVLTFQLSALQDPDPFSACYWGASEHPLYHDCIHCEHSIDGSCDYGLNILFLLNSKYITEKYDLTPTPIRDDFDFKIDFMYQNLSDEDKKFLDTFNRIVVMGEIP